MAQRQSDNPTPTRVRVGGRSTPLPPEEARRKFLDRLAKAGNVTDACKVARISRDTAYEWRALDPTFAAAWAGALDTAADVLEREAVRRAVKGWDEEAYSAGRAVGTVRRYSDRLLEFLLTGARPEKYRKNVKAEISANVNGSVVVSQNGKALQEMLDAKLGGNAEARAVVAAALLELAGGSGADADR